MKVTSILLAAIAAIAAFTTTSNAVQAADNRRYRDWSPETKSKIIDVRTYGYENAYHIAEILDTLVVLSNDNDITVTERKDEVLSNTLTELKHVLVKLDRTKLDQISRRLNAFVE